MNQYTQEQIEQWKKKAEKWDKLDMKISSFYPSDDDSEEGGEFHVFGEAAAIAFGWL